MKQSTISKILPVLLIATSVGAVLVTTCAKILSSEYKPKIGIEKPSVNFTPLGLVIAHSGMTHATLIEKQGAILAEVALPKLATEVSGSPHSNLLAYVAADTSGFSHIFTFSLLDRSIRQLTFGKAMDRSPKMSGDGATVFFVRSVTPGMMVAGWVDSDVYAIDTGGSAARRLSEENFIWINDLEFYPDQTHLLFSGVPSQGFGDDYSNRLFQIDLQPAPSCHQTSITTLKIKDPYLMAAANYLAVVSGNVEGGGYFDHYLIDARSRHSKDLGKAAVESMTASVGKQPIIYALPENESDGDLLYRSEPDDSWHRVYVNSHVRPFAYTKSADGKITPMK